MKIGELARNAQCTVETVRYYEKAGLLAEPARTEGNFRVYGPEHLERLRLIRAHPELAGKAAVRGELTDESTREQKGAGLDQCSAEEFERMQELNRRYNEKFGFPFVIAVKGHDRHSILRAFAERLENPPAAEAAECIEQIIRIGGFRLADAIAA